MSTGRLVSAALVILLALGAAPAAAADGVAVELGRGDGADMARVAVQWNWNKRWFERGAWHLGGYWDFALGYWHRDAAPGQNEDLWEVGATPVLRYQRNDLSGVYFEIGVGAHLLSESTLGNRRFSTLFQFGDHFGIGFRFGEKGRYDIGYRYQHLSNGGIKEPNSGINFSQIRLQHHF